VPVGVLHRFERPPPLSVTVRQSSYENDQENAENGLCHRGPRGAGCPAQLAAQTTHGPHGRRRRRYERDEPYPEAKPNASPPAQLPNCHQSNTAEGHLDWPGPGNAAKAVPGQARVRNDKFVPVRKR
jgi:hypothetical protein